MQLNINSFYKDDGTLIYKFQMYDGPDGIDEFEGEANSLGEAVDKVISWRAINNLDYMGYRIVKDEDYDKLLGV